MPNQIQHRRSACRTGPLRRPAVLIDAALRGRQAYLSDRKQSATQGSATGEMNRDLIQLAAREAMLEQQRLQHAPGYSPGLHIAVLTAYLAEAALASDNI